MRHMTAPRMPHSKITTTGLPRSTHIIHFTLTMLTGFWGIVWLRHWMKARKREVTHYHY